MEQIAGVGIDVVMVSWWGPGGDGDVQLPLILEVAHDEGLAVTVIIEPIYETAAEIHDGIRYLVETYGQHPGFYRSAHFEGRPLLYTFDPFRLDQTTNQFRVGSDPWAEVLLPEGGATIRGTDYDAALIADVGIPNFIELVGPAGFDGAYNYVVTGITVDPERVPDYARRAEAHDIPFFPSISPGYLDERIRPWNAAGTRDRREGDHFWEMYELATAHDPGILSITSFNEWHEGTQIEPATPRTEGDFVYEGYGDLPETFYLDVAAEIVTDFKSP